MPVPDVEQPDQQVVGLAFSLLPASFSMNDDPDVVEQYDESNMPAKVAPGDAPAPDFVIFSAKARWFMALFQYVFNEICAYFWSSLWGGILDSFCPWTPGLDLCYTKEMFHGIRIGGNKLKFEPKCCDWFCFWIKNRILATITFGFYDCCCKGQKKRNIWMDKQIVLEGHEEEETIYYGAKIPVWKDVLYMFFNLIAFFATLGMLRPHCLLWYAKQKCKSMKFGGQDIRIEGASYCDFWKIYWCKCGWACDAKLKKYLDEHTVIGSSNTVQVMGALKGMLPGKLPGMGGDDKKEEDKGEKYEKKEGEEGK